MPAVRETPPGAIPEGARKTVSDTTISSVPAVISRADCAAERKLLRPGLSPTRCLLMCCAGPGRRRGAAASDCRVPRRGRCSGCRHHPHGVRWKRNRLHLTDARQVEAAFVEGVEGDLSRAPAELDGPPRPQ